ncbi:hypothetical protein HanRHA438_Chr09g0383791 [Helianthus annuus]|nr:hypothetical protein HanRHA438_Chr09g0383791 [Helianthus annuus]
MLVNVIFSTDANWFRLYSPVMFASNHRIWNCRLDFIDVNFQADVLVLSWKEREV